MGGHRPELLAALSGVLLVLSFPKFGHWTLGWIALVPLLLGLTGAGIRCAARLGFLTGTVSGVGLLYWTALVVAQFGGLSLPIATLIMLLLCLAVALFLEVDARVLRAIQRHQGAELRIHRAGRELLGGHGGGPGRLGCLLGLGDLGGLRGAERLRFERREVLFGDLRPLGAGRGWLALLERLLTSALPGVAALNSK